MDGSKVRYFLLFFFVSAINRVPGEESVKKQKILSFYQGQLLWKELCRNQEIPYDLEQIIAGMRAAEKGEKPPYSEEELLIQVRQFQEELLEKQTRENLVDAETFLAKMAKEETIELIPNKLYYKQLKKGSGKIVTDHSAPLLIYSVWTQNRKDKQCIYSLHTPSSIELEETIQGFAGGVIGMQEGEVRQIFVHPDLAYGTYGKLDPNLLVIFEVEVVSIDDKEKS